MNLFDAPMLEIKEYYVRWDTRCIVRTMDILMSGLLIVLAIPLWISRFIIKKDTEMGTILKTPCVGQNEKLRMDIFYIQNYSISLNMKLLLMYIKKVMTV